MRRTDDDAGLPAPSVAAMAFIWFHRIMALYCLLFGTLYWVRLSGVYPGELWRFDLMPAHWKLASAALAVLFPFAAAGLWMVASWGPVIWFICAAAEIVMYGAFPELFGAKLSILVSHALVALLYVAFRVALRYQARGPDGGP
ncbi:MAG: DUF6163 family protein [Rhizobiaceae bacterium]